MSWITIGIGAGAGALGGGSYANSKGQDPVKGALLGATVGGLGGWAAAPAAAAPTATTAAGTTAAGGAGTAAGTGATTSTFAGAAPLSGTTVASGELAAGTMPAYTGATSAQPSFWSGLGKDVGKGVAVNSTMQAGNAAFNPPPTVRTPGQPLTLQQPQPLQFQRLNFG